jgi:hypothetical protein
MSLVQLTQMVCFSSECCGGSDSVTDTMAGSDQCNISESQAWAGREAARLVMLQFCIDQMALEVYVFHSNVILLADL